MENEFNRESKKEYNPKDIFNKNSLSQISSNNSSIEFFDDNLKNDTQLDIKKTANNLQMNFNFVKASISYAIITVLLLLLAHFLDPTADINDAFFYLLTVFFLSAIIVYFFFRGPATKTKSILLILLAPIILGVISTILFLCCFAIYSAFGGHLSDMWGLFVVITVPIAIITGFINGIFLVLTKNFCNRIKKMKEHTNN